MIPVSGYHESPAHGRGRGIRLRPYFRANAFLPANPKIARTVTIERILEAPR